MISNKRYFQLSLLLPLVFALLYPLVKASLETIDLWLCVVFISISWYNIIPYTCFVIIMFLWSFNKSDAKLRKVVFIYPFLYLPIWSLYFIFFIELKRASEDVFLIYLIMTNLYILILGYMYIGLAYLIHYFIVRRFQ